MAGEIQLAYGTTGHTLYAVDRNSVGQIWNANLTAFESYNAANWTDYALAMTEQGSSGYYTGGMPLHPEGVYMIEVRRRIGGGPAVTDPPVGGGEIQWSSGTTVIPLSDLSTLTGVDIQSNVNVVLGAALPANMELLSISGSGVVSASVAADGITAASLATDAGTEIGTAVWASGTRTLTSGANIVLAKGTGVTGFNDLSAAQVNAEADTALADAGVTTTVTGRIDAAITSRPTLAQILAGGDVDGYTLEQTLKLCLAALAGKLSGAATTTVTIRASDDSKDRIVATVDSNGNRTSVTLDATG